MSKLRQWLEGRKTYLVVTALVLAVLIAGATGRATPSMLSLLLVLGVSIFAATFRAAIERHHDEEMELLEELAETGACLASRNVPKAALSAMRAVGAGLALAQEVGEETQPR